jgi:hypothetical protein
MNINKSEMLEELWEFFLAFSTTLEDAKITYNKQEKYLMQRRGYNEISDIYKWVFTKFMKVVKEAHIWQKFPLEQRKYFRVLESPEYTRYIEQLKEISKLWRQRPWVC